MKLTERPTPETDNARINGGWLVRADFARSLEQRLGAATEALEFYAFAPGTMEILKDAGLKARETLAAIKEKK